MPFETTKIIIEKAVAYSWLWAVWWVAMQLNQIRKWEKFRFWMFVANIWLAVWIWYIAGNLIPDSIWEIKYSIISICWFLSHPILNFIEKKWLAIILKKLLWDK